MPATLPPPVVVEVNGHPVPKPEPPVDPDEMGKFAKWAIPLGLLVLTPLVFIELVGLWPAVVAGTGPVKAPILFGLWHAHGAEVVMLLMVTLAGMLGALIATGRKFQRYAHHEQLTARDQWSYVFLPLQGAMLALVVYFTFRAGFLGSSGTAPLNPFGIAAIAGLVGLFTDSAMHRLREVMELVLGKTKQPTVAE